MRSEDVKIGMKVVPMSKKGKDIKKYFEECDSRQSNFFNKNGFLYVTKQKGYDEFCLWLNLEPIGDHFSPRDFKPFELPQPHKSLLKSGDKVVRRDGSVRFTLIELGKFFSEEISWSKIEHFTDELFEAYNDGKFDIMEIYRGDELIAKRIEKSAKEIEIERIENEMRKLADDLRKVKGE